VLKNSAEEEDEEGEEQEQRFFLKSMHKDNSSSSESISHTQPSNQQTDMNKVIEFVNLIKSKTQNQQQVNQSISHAPAKDPRVKKRKAS
jgi:hypothetical protein